MLDSAEDVGKKIRKVCLSSRSLFAVYFCGSIVPCLLSSGLVCNSCALRIVERPSMIWNKKYLVCKHKFQRFCVKCLLLSVRELAEHNRGCREQCSPPTLGRCGTGNRCKILCLSSTFVCRHFVKKETLLTMECSCLSSMFWFQYLVWRVSFRTRLWFSVQSFRFLFLGLLLLDLFVNCSFNTWCTEVRFYQTPLHSPETRHSLYVLPNPHLTTWLNQSLAQWLLHCTALK